MQISNCHLSLQFDENTKVKLIMDEKQKNTEIIKIRKKDLQKYNEKSKKLSVYDPVKHYIWKANKYPLLTKEEEEELMRLYKESNDAAAGKKLLLSHLRLVVKIAFEYYNKYYCQVLDLIQEGNVGLLTALKKFSMKKNVRFSTYAQWWIRAYVLKFLMDNYSIIRIGHSRAEKRLFYSLKKAKDKLTAMGIDPNNPKLLAEYMKESERDVIDMNRRLHDGVISLDQPITTEDDATIGNKIGVDSINLEEDIINKELMEKLKGKLKDFRAKLNEKESFIWDKRILAENPISLQTIGDIYNVTRERIRQIEERILKKLKKYLSEQKDFNPDDFLKDG